MSYPAAKGNTGVPPVLASGHPDRVKSLAGRTPATRHSRDGHVPLHEKAAAPHSVRRPPGESIVNGGTRRKFHRQHPPLAAGLEEITDGNITFPHALPAGGPSRLAGHSLREKQGLQQSPFLVAHICRVKQFGKQLAWQIASTSSMQMKMEPSGRRNCRNSMRRGYIMQSHLSCLVRSSPSLPTFAASGPTTSANHFLISGAFTLSL